MTSPSGNSPNKNVRKNPWLLAGLACLLIALTIFIWGGGQKGEEVKDLGQQENPAVTSPRERSERPNRVADRQLVAQNVKTDVSLSEFPTREYQRVQSTSQKAAGAPPGEAYVHVPSASRRVIMEANQIGEFPTIDTQPNDTVGVRVALDGVKPGTPVRVVILDGGTFPAQQGAALLMKAAEWRGVAFEYTTSPNIGTHRVLVHAAGHESRIFDFNAIEPTDG